MPSKRSREVTVGAVMQRKVVTLGPAMTLREAVARLVERQISGAPVVDEEERLVGVLSQTDLVRYQQRTPAPGPAIPSYYQQLNGEAFVTRLQFPEDSAARVRDLMTPAAFMTEATTPVADAARLLLRKRVHRLLVTRRGKLVGIVTSMDLLRGLLRRRA
jgi:CBS domain-containing protein